MGTATGTPHELPRVADPLDEIVRQQRMGDYRRAWGEIGSVRLDLRPNAPLPVELPTVAYLPEGTPSLTLACPGVPCVSAMDGAWTREELLRRRSGLPLDYFLPMQRFMLTFTERFGTCGTLHYTGNRHLEGVVYTPEERETLVRSVRSGIFVYESVKPWFLARLDMPPSNPDAMFTATFDLTRAKRWDVERIASFLNTYRWDAQ